MIISNHTYPINPSHQKLAIYRITALLTHHSPSHASLLPSTVAETVEVAVDQHGIGFVPSSDDADMGDQLVFNFYNVASPFSFHFYFTSLLGKSWKSCFGYVIE